MMEVPTNIIVLQMGSSISARMLIREPVACPVLVGRYRERAMGEDVPEARLLVLDSLAL